MSEGLGFKPCRLAMGRSIALRRSRFNVRLKGEEYSLFASGGVGLPSGLSQKPFVDTSSEGEVPLAVVAENATRADQKLVSFSNFPSGRSMMKRPSWEVSQKPPRTASSVQTYVFCYVKAHYMGVRGISSYRGHLQAGGRPPWT